MRRVHGLLAGAAFVAGVAVGIAATTAGKVDPGMYKGKDPKDASRVLLPAALAQAGKGTWETIAVGRVYYLTGDKAEGQALFDRVINAKPAESDWMRLGRIYLEANEWDKARDAFDKAVALDPKDAGNLVEVGGWYNLHGDRAKAEELFDQAFKRKADDVWCTVNAAGSYVGVKPQ